MRGHHKRSVAGGWIWLLPVTIVLVQVLVLFPGLFRVFSALLIPAGLLLLCAYVLVSVTWPARSGVIRWGTDEFEDEEAARHRRLAHLAGQAEQMEQTLRDLRDLRLGPEESTRAQWAAIELEEALTRTRRAMADQRAALFSLQSLRWLTQIETLLRGLDRADARMSPAALADRLSRLPRFRAEGEELLNRIRGDDEAASTSSGAQTVRLIEESLEELATLRVDLLTRQASLLARSGVPDPAYHNPEPGLSRLKDRISRARAEREVRSWTTHA